MNTLVYLSYGNGKHIAETWYSIYSARYFLGLSPSDVRIVIYTEDPANFEGLPAELRIISQDELSEWLGPNNYKHRRKTCAIIDALQRYGGRVAFIDSDTWFIQSPARLFDRIAPGRTCLHILETRLRDSSDVEHREFIEYLARNPLRDLAGNLVDALSNDEMWNSGVAGIAAEDAPLMREVLNIVDQVSGNYDKAPFIEQFATGYFFGRGTTIAEAKDIVFHFWPTYLRGPFTTALPQLLGDTAHLDPMARARALYEQRPRPSGLRLLKHWVRELLHAVGRTGIGVRNSG